MTNVEIQKELEKYPYLQKCLDKFIFVSEEEILFYKNAELVMIGNKKINRSLLIRFLKDPIFYNHALKYLQGEKSGLGIASIKYGDIGQQLIIDKITFINGLMNIDGDDLSSEEIQRLEILKSEMSYIKFKDKVKNQRYYKEIDGYQYAFAVADLIYVMEMCEEEFKKICNDTNVVTIKGVPKEHLIYAAYHFYKDNNCDSDYILPEVIVDRLLNYPAFYDLDIEAINTYNTTTDKLYKDAPIDHNIETIIKEDMPESLTTLERAIYYYIKMCKLFTYDEEYYIVDQKGPEADKHKTISYLSNITPVNRNVVCYEFNIIYSKLLDELGLHFSSDYKGMVGETYNSGNHANLTFRCGKYLIKADAVTSILNGDLFNAKLNQPLVGLKCKNCSPKTRRDFKQIVSGVYKIIVSKETDGKYSRLERKEDFRDILDEYLIATENVDKIPLLEKVRILLRKLNESTLIKIDALSYLLQLKKIIFNKEEQKENVDIRIVKDIVNRDRDKIASACAIICVNPLGFAYGGSLYYYFVPGISLQVITEEEVQRRYTNKEIEDISNDENFNERGDNARNDRWTKKNK